MDTAYFQAQAKVAEASQYLLGVKITPDADPENNRDDLLVAIEIFQEALDLAAIPEAYIGLAYIAWAFQDVKTALIMLKTALGLEPEHPDACHMLQQIQEQWGIQRENLSQVNKLVQQKEQEKGPQQAFKKALGGLLGKTAQKVGPEDDFLTLLKNVKK